MAKTRINLLWQGLYAEKRYGHWQDGLHAAMKLLEKNYDVRYLEPSHPDIANCDVILYWEALCTFAGKDRENYIRVQNQSVPKILLFAGGPIKKEWCKGFDIFLVESEINENKDYLNSCIHLSKILHTQNVLNACIQSLNEKKIIEIKD